MDKYGAREFQLDFRLNNAAFETPEDENAEIVRILRKIADVFEGDALRGMNTLEGTISDINGNRIGSFYRDEREEDKDEDEE